MCSTCAGEKLKGKAERREWLKSIGYCPVCGKNMLFGEEKICPECLADKYSRSCKDTDKKHKQYLVRASKKKEQGLCHSCSNKAAEGHTYCLQCLAKRRVQEKRYRALKSGDYMDRGERYGYGLCYRCGEPLDTDKRLCSTCCEATAKNFRGIRGTNAYWQADNKRVFGGAANG